MAETLQERNEQERQAMQRCLVSLGFASAGRTGLEELWRPPDHGECFRVPDAVVGDFQIRMAETRAMLAQRLGIPQLAARYMSETGGYLPADDIRRCAEAARKREPETAERLSLLAELLSRREARVVYL